MYYIEKCAVFQKFECVEKREIGCYRGRKSKGVCVLGSLQEITKSTFLSIIIRKHEIFVENQLNFFKASNWVLLMGKEGSNLGDRAIFRTEWHGT